jgi:hypothetical protein
MKPKITEAEFTVVAAQSGLPLSAEQKRTLYDAYWMIEDMIELVNKPMPREAEPAHIFIAEAR